ncbi:TPA_asm: fiber [Capsaspora MELD virus 1]|nr:TPA_asm: fiber [Capsaspora MELD virus 1]
MSTVPTFIPALFTDGNSNVTKAYVDERLAGKVNNINGTASNLTLTGTTATVTSVDVKVNDKIIELNQNETGAGLSGLTQSGLLINRGSENNAYIVFDDADDAFKVGFEGDLKTVVTSTDLSEITGDITALGTDVSDLQSAVNSMSTVVSDIAALETDVGDLQTAVAGLSTTSVTRITTQPDEGDDYSYTVLDSDRLIIVDFPVNDDANINIHYPTNPVAGHQVTLKVVTRNFVESGNLYGTNSYVNAYFSKNGVDGGITVFFPNRGDQYVTAVYDPVLFRWTVINSGLPSEIGGEKQFIDGIYIPSGKALIGDVTGDITGDVTAESISASVSATLPDTTVTGTIDMSGNVIQSVGTPSESDDAATKGYVDTAVADADYLPLAGGTLTGALLVPDGSASTPAIALASDTDTGIYSDLGALCVSAGGTMCAYFNALGIRTGLDVAAQGSVTGARVYATIQFLAGNGNATNPAYTFTTNDHTGLYSAGTNQLGVSANSTNVATFSTTGLNVAGGVQAATLSAYIGGQGYAICGSFTTGSYSTSSGTTFSCDGCLTKLLDGTFNSVELRLNNFNSAANAFLVYNFLSSGTPIGTPVWPVSGSGSYSSQNIIGAGGVGFGSFQARGAGVIVGNTVDTFTGSQGLCGTLRFYVSGSVLKHEGTLVCDAAGANSSFITSGKYTGTISGITGIQFTYLNSSSVAQNFTGAAVRAYGYT